MKIHVISLFPEVIQHYCAASIMGRAQEAGLIKVNCVTPRDFTDNPWHKVDDAPYGGGAGMVMQCDPIMKAYESLLPLPEKTQVLLMTPVGHVFQQSTACDIAQNFEAMVILCGHYEGIDARILELIPNIQSVCVGDFVVTGGELPALMIIDAVSRQIPGVLGKEASAAHDSFMNPQRLEAPHYTRPQSYRGLDVPEVLLSGNHAAIAAWRDAQSLALTEQYRPDLIPPGSNSPPLAANLSGLKLSCAQGAIKYPAP